MKSEQALIILTGPKDRRWAKTALSIKLARAVGGEIISADSMQVYRHMDIGYGKRYAWRRWTVCRHHLIDILEPTEDFNVVRFQALCPRRRRKYLQPAEKFRSWQVEPAFIFRHCSMILISPRSTKIHGIREEMERLACRTGGGSSARALLARSIRNRRRRSTQTM